MSDFAGKPFLDPNMFQNTSTSDFRKMFIEQMRSFADTIEGSENGSMVLTMLIPYLSMFNAEDMMKNIDDGKDLIDVLRSAADVVEECDDDRSGVIFGYQSNGSLNLVVFDFTKGTVETQQRPMSDPDKSLAGMLHFENSLKKSLIAAALEKDMIPLTRSTLVLSGVSVDVY